MYPHIKDIIEVFGKEPSTLDELCSAILAMIDAKYPGMITGLALDLSYSQSLSNTHSCPIEGKTNWGHRDANRPTGYPGFRGRVWIRTSHHSVEHANILTQLARINLGSGGYGSYDGPWEKISNNYHRISRSLKAGSFYSYKPNIYSYDCKLYIDDYPEISKYVSKKNTYDILRYNNIQPIHHKFEWTDNSILDTDREFLTMAQKYTNDKLLIGIVGLIGSGKSTIANELTKTFGFEERSFATSVKSAVCAIFGYSVEDIAGITEKSRIWRETVDEWWSNRLGIPNLTPRKILQYFGTDVMRNHFHDDIWIASLERKMLNSTCNIVISDTRFANEIESIRKMGGIIVRVKRNDPEWLDDAYVVNKQLPGHEESLRKLEGIHPSEYGWVGCDIDYIIENDGTISDLKYKLDKLMVKILEERK